MRSRIRSAESASTSTYGGTNKSCLNRIAGLGVGPPWYGLAFQLGDEVAAEHRTGVQLHRVPRYTVAAVRQVDAVLAHNGADRTWHVGAWLGDGMQEGAVRTALDVAAALGAPDARSSVGDAPASAEHADRVAGRGQRSRTSSRT
jgi:predicted NAD/FAD-binding protein